MARLNSNMTIEEINCYFPLARNVLERYGFTGKEERNFPLQKACSNKGLDPENIISEILDEQTLAKHPRAESKLAS